MEQKTQLQHNTELNYRFVPRVLRANKIICTIGPATQSVDALKKLMNAGMNIARMNFSHGSHEYHQQTIENIRQAAKEMNLYVAIALDTKGPEIRCGLFTEPEVQMKASATCIVTTDKGFEEKGTAEKFYIDYKGLADAVKPGGLIYIDDGILRLHVLEILNKTDVKCQVYNNHIISNRKGVNLPMTNVDLPAVSERDKLDLMFGAKQGVDFVFASFIRTAQQVRDVREALGEEGKFVKVISKIENHQGCDNIDDIIAESDGIMVARGDLGVEIPAEKVVIAQKMIISKCNIVGKPVICATQMLDSMTNNFRPTRAEVSDVANAVLDGADCVMLSGETAKGKYPNEVVSYMNRICVEAQTATWNFSVFNAIKISQAHPMSPEEAICSAAVQSSNELGANAIVVLTNTGRSAQLLAKYRPCVPILATSQRKAICRSVAVMRGVIPIFYDNEKLGEDYDREKRVWLAINTGKEMGILSEGDLVVAVHADAKTKGFANMTRIVYVK